MSLTAVTTECHRCAGAGSVESSIVEETYTCPECGGHGRLPIDGHIYWFYQPMRYEKAATQRIACVQNEAFDEDRSGAGQWRISYYAPTGPITHDIVERPFREVSSYRYAPTAARLLDHWSRQPMWAEGLRQLNWMMLESALRFVGYGWSVIGELWHLPHQMRIDAAKYLIRKKEMEKSNA